MDFRRKFGDDRFVDVSFSDLQTDPVTTVANCYEQLGLTFSNETRASVKQWADKHRPGHRGTEGDDHSSPMRQQEGAEPLHPSATAGRKWLRERALADQTARHRSVERVGE